MHNILLKPPAAKAECCTGVPVWASPHLSQPDLVKTS